MAYTYHDLKLKTVQELRDIAKDVQHDAVQGYSQMNKEHLLPALCKALGIDKPALKAKLRALNAERAKALDAHDHDLLKNIRRQRHRITRDIRRHLD